MKCPYWPFKVMYVQFVPYTITRQHNFPLSTNKFKDWAKKPPFTNVGRRGISSCPLVISAVVLIIPNELFSVKVLYQQIIVRHIRFQYEKGSKINPLEFDNCKNK